MTAPNTHTPGPWTVQYGRSWRNHAIFDSPSNPVDRYGNQQGRDIYGPSRRLARLEEAIEPNASAQERIDSDARLIAAAPDLFDALAQWIKEYDDNGWPKVPHADKCQCGPCLARAALAKASPPAAPRTTP